MYQSLNNTDNSSWVNFRNNLVNDSKNSVLKKFEEKGIQVFVKTDLGSEMLVYDSANVNNKSNNFLKFGVKIKDKNGKIITEFGKYPKTSTIKMVALYSVAAIGLYTIFKGVKNFY